MDKTSFKSIMSSFPSGVSVVTALDADGRPRGLTCSAVCSVSLEPSLLLVCVGKSSDTLPVLRKRKSFVVNFLAENGAEIAGVCASKSEDKFAGIAWLPSRRAHGAPILVDVVSAYVECSLDSIVDAGDHLVLIGRAEDGACYAGRDPLLYMRGKLGNFGVRATQAA